MSTLCFLLLLAPGHPQPLQSPQWFPSSVSNGKCCCSVLFWGRDCRMFCFPFIFLCQSDTSVITLLPTNTGKKVELLSHFSSIISL